MNDEISFFCNKPSLFKFTSTPLQVFLNFSSDSLEAVCILDDEFFTSVLHLYRRPSLKNHSFRETIACVYILSDGNINKAERRITVIKTKSKPSGKPFGNELMKTLPKEKGKWQFGFSPWRKNCQSLKDPRSPWRPNPFTPAGRHVLFNWTDRMIFALSKLPTDLRYLGLWVIYQTEIDCPWICVIDHAAPHTWSWNFWYTICPISGSEATGISRSDPEYSLLKKYKTVEKNTQIYREAVNLTRTNVKTDVRANVGTKLQLTPVQLSNLISSFNDLIGNIALYLNFWFRGGFSWWFKVMYLSKVTHVSKSVGSILKCEGTYSGTYFLGHITTAGQVRQPTGQHVLLG